MGNKEIIERIFKSSTDSKLIHEAVLLVENSSGDFSASLEYGGKTIDTLINSASVGKLFTTTCIIMLQEQKRLSLDNLVVDYFDKNTFNGLHKFKGVDYSHKLTLSDLLFQTSGIPDYETEGGIIERAIKEDFHISTSELIEITKTLKPHFAPIGKKAYYSDLNFQLLGEIIEKTTQTSLEEVFRNYIFEPLGLTKTYVPVDKDFVPNIFFKNKSLCRPKLIMSLRGGGNTISTSRELMIFLKAFFNGHFFPQTIFEKLSCYRKLQISMGPIHYGGGYMQIPLNTIMTLFKGKGELLGHSGSTGSFAFYYPNKDLYFVGDTNQMANPGFPIRLIMKLAISVK
ncbi:MAG TPA: serine hydrolase domain-containing protein [Ignavibacteriaceae bacterium]|jgi:CubicO group peptidase (beta-lactamase class C family)|nr:MAG: hypothetical protein B6D44_02495 [Ignavibacteriales bacterium UTCHB2]HQF41593.1 serine hydrolase domain-containing protein [Ignavibacteriaceae bacterium]HQI40745.1 serine hydrolase domain-containing protein [Ignavibacteriaceae bacterium]